MSRSRILLVDDEPGILFSVRSFLESSGFAVETAESLAAATQALRADLPDAVVVDHQLPDGDSFDLLHVAKDIDAGIPLVVLTAHGSIDLAVRAIKEGADHFLTKPVELAALLVTLQRAIENRRNRQRHLAAQASSTRQAPDPFIGVSASIRRLAEDARRVLDAESPILIRGETGSGKGVLARWLHAPRRRSSTSTALGSRASSWRRSSSATTRVPSPERRRASRAFSRPPTAAPSSSTRSATWIRRSSPSSSR